MVNYIRTIYRFVPGAITYFGMIFSIYFYLCRFIIWLTIFFFNLWLFLAFFLSPQQTYTYSLCWSFFSYFNCLFNAHFFASLQQSIFHYLGRNSFFLHAACGCCCCCLLSVINIKIQKK